LYAVILLDEQLPVGALFFFITKKTASRRYTFTENKRRRVGVRCD
jgi:hypothetical protein